jgi:Cof subfamily protein (haloacid dehalogenase superfamily)
VKGCICLDIDGTLTLESDRIPKRVLSCLERLHLEGWMFLFATGRTFSYASRALLEIKFPYFFTVQNGANLLQMPEEIHLHKKYLPGKIIPQLEKLHKGMPEDYLIYSGLEKGDFCYYRPSRFSKVFEEHNERISVFSTSPWVKVDDFSALTKESFPLIKSIGTREEMLALHKKLQEIKETTVSFIKDPLSKHVYLNLITAKGASKGNMVKFMRKKFPEGTLFIAAGDDFNDVSMLEEADIAIVMGQAPKEMRPLADIIAKPAKEEGIVEALLEATT